MKKYKQIENWFDIPEPDLINYEMTKTGKFRNKKSGKILKPWLNNDGYLCIGLMVKRNSRKMFLVHRLIAQNFIPNPYNLPTVDHINRVKTDNRIENLRWADMKLQCKNRDNSVFSEYLRNMNITTKSKPVLQYTKDNVFVSEYQSAMEAYRQTGIRHISECCNNHVKTAGGYIWYFKNDN